MPNYLIFITICLGATACQPYSPDDLAGSWKAITVVEESDTLDLDLSNVNLNFFEDRFQYQHTPRDSMSGTFALKRGLINLYVTRPELDTIIIQVNDLSTNKLILRMNHEGKERLVTMER